MYVDVRKLELLRNTPKGAALLKYDEGHPDEYYLLWLRPSAAEDYRSGKITPRLLRALDTCERTVRKRGGSQIGLQL